MEHRSLIFLIVFIVFVYIIGRYKLLPYLAARKILKDAKTDKNGGSTNGTGTAGSSPADTLTSLAALAALTHGANPCTTAPVQMPPTQPQGRDKRDMYFDYTAVDPLDIPRGMAGIDGLLAGLRNRGICPDTFGLVPLPDGSLIAYVVYTL